MLRTTVNRYLRLRATPLYVFLLLCSNTAFSETFEFALIGDLPYGVKLGEKNRESAQLINDLNHQNNLAWVLHIGDIKTGKSSCSDEFILDRYQRFSKIKHPFIYTPGDNEWTDCHNPLAGGYDPLERLAFVRKLFYNNTKEKNTKDALNIASQPELQKEHDAFIENYYWKKDDIHFVTLHIVGSLDGTKPFSPLSKVRRRKKHDQAVKTRQKAALDWLSFVFNRARTENAKGLVIAIHANPGWDLRWEKENRPAYKFFNKALSKELKSFHKPVLVLHGDSHTMRVDKPSIDGRRNAPANFTRVESFGENNNGWIKIKVDSASNNVFSFEIYDRD